VTWHVRIRNVAGILDGAATLAPGPNAVRASNWQGKSSFVAAVRVALGVSRDLTEGRDRGSVVLELPDRTVTVELVRAGDRIDCRGDPYLTDEYDVARASLFACLDERNELRRTVREGGNLEEVLLRPLDFQNIDERIADLRGERERIESELSGAESAKRRLPSVQEKVTRLEAELAETRETYERLTGGEQTAPDGRDDDTTPAAEHGDGPGVANVSDVTAAAGATGSELATARSELDRLGSRVDRLERSVDRVETRLAEKRETLEALDPEPPDEIEAELAAARDRYQSVNRDAEVVQSLYSATERVLTENRVDLVADVQRGLTGDTVACWTCGGETTREALEAQLEAIGERVRELRTEADRHREEVERLEARREEVTQRQRQKQDLQSEIADLEATLSDNRQSLADARERYETVADRVDSLTAAVDETVEELTDVESELKYRKAELADARDELETLETRADRVDELSEEHEGVVEEIERLQGRKTEVKRQTRAAFDDAMAEILARFDTGFETARLTSEFELVVARDGREASLDALSMGELELLGFVAALAGYETFDVAEIVPVLLVDGVGDLADDNLHTLVEILRERAKYLVFTVYPEYAAFDGREIDPSDWVLATDDESPGSVE
jgi:DNA repair exonuclease SbcCD ATPase subunit